MKHKSTGRFRILSNGENLILDCGDGVVWIAKQSYLKNFVINTSFPSMDVDFIGNYRRRVQTEPPIIEATLTLLLQEVEYQKDSLIDLDQLLFSNVEILKVLKIARDKVQKRG